MTVLRSAWIVVALALAACAETEEEPPQARQPAARVTAVKAHGLTGELPLGWQSATVSLTPHLTDPREELAVATFPLRYRQRVRPNAPPSPPTAKVAVPARR